jgi:hypothetical protein
MAHAASTFRQQPTRADVRPHSRNRSALEIGVSTYSDMSVPMRVDRPPTYVPNRNY